MPDEKTAGFLCSAAFLLRYCRQHGTKGRDRAILRKYAKYLQPDGVTYFLRALPQKGRR
jgi:hypothetical protein